MELNGTSINTTGSANQPDCVFEADPDIEGAGIFIAGLIHFVLTCVISIVTFFKLVHMGSFLRVQTGRSQRVLAPTESRVQEGKTLVEAVFEIPMASCILALAIAIATWSIPTSPYHISLANNHVWLLATSGINILSGQLFSFSYHFKDNWASAKKAFYSLSWRATIPIVVFCVAMSITGLHDNNQGWNTKTCQTEEDVSNLVWPEQWPALYGCTGIGLFLAILGVIHDKIRRYRRKSDVDGGSPGLAWRYWCRFTYWSIVSLLFLASSGIGFSIGITLWFFREKIRELYIPEVETGPTVAQIMSFVMAGGAAVHIAVRVVLNKVDSNKNRKPALPTQKTNGCHHASSLHHATGTYAHSTYPQPQVPYAGIPQPQPQGPYPGVPHPQPQRPYPGAAQPSMHHRR